MEREDTHATHYGLHLDGSFSGYARHERPAYSAGTIGVPQLNLPHRIDHICVDPDRDADGRLLAALVRFMLAAVWVDAPDARILLTVPGGSRAEGDLAQLGERVQLMMASTPPALGQMWLVSSTDPGDDPTQRPELADVLGDYGDQWKRANAVSVLAAEGAVRWA